MGIFSKKKEEKKIVLVFDIGSSSVGGALFEVQKNGIPKIILSIRESIILEKEVDTVRFLSLTLRSLEIVANKICKSGVGSPSKIFCVLSAPWYASQTRTIKIEKNVPFKFDSKFANNLIQKEISIFEEEYLKKFENTKDQVKMIEFKSIKTMLNGYMTPNPFNKKAKKLEMDIFISMSSKFVLDKIEETIFKHFHLRDIKFSSFAMASFIVARDLFMDSQDFILVDICGEITDISIIKKDILNSSASYPLGSNFMIRGITNNLNCSLDEAKSFFSLYKDGHATESLEKKLETIMKRLKTEWLKKFQEALFNISNDISIPTTIFVTVDKELANFFSEIIKSEHLYQYTLTESKYKIILLDSQIFHGFVMFKNGISRDPFLIISTIYINRFIC